MRIARGIDPGPYSKHTDYKPHLRPLFRQRCAYCLVPDDRLGGLEGMTVDHFLPRDRYAHLLTTWGNLYYACSACNEHYKRNHPTAAEEAQGLAFVDPCSQDPDDHFFLVQEAKTGHYCTVRGRTARARYTIRILKLNWRPFLRDLWRELDLRDADARENLRLAVRLIRQMRRQLRFDPHNAELHEVLRASEEQRAKIQGSLDAIAAQRSFPLRRAC